MNMRAYIPEFKKACGKKIDPAALHFIELFCDICEEIEQRGRADARERHPARSDDVFLALAKDMFSDDSDAVTTVAALVQMCYIEGYRKGQEVQ